MTTDRPSEKARGLCMIWQILLSNIERIELRVRQPVLCNEIISKESRKMHAIIIDVIT